MHVELDTLRLKLRPWRESDLAPFAALNSDARVMEFLLGPLTREQSDAMAARFIARLEESGWGPWAVEEKSTGEFIGYIGLNVPTHAFAFSPCVEIAWRLAVPSWGRGLASEGARAALKAGFDAGLEEIVSLTTLANARSRAVMTRIGMHEDVAGQFDHPAVPDGHALQRHRLYRLRRDEWLARASERVHEQRQP